MRNWPRKFSPVYLLINRAPAWPFGGSAYSAFRRHPSPPGGGFVEGWILEDLVSKEPGDRLVLHKVNRRRKPRQLACPNGHQVCERCYPLWVDLSAKESENVICGQGELSCLRRQIKVPPGAPSGLGVYRYSSSGFKIAHYLQPCGATSMTKGWIGELPSDVAPVPMHGLG